MQLRPNSLALTAVLALLTAMGPLSVDMYLPSMPAIARELGTDAAHVQLTLSIFLVGFAVGQFFHGPLSDRFGRKPTLLVGLACYVVASAICAFTRSIELLILARFVQAVAACGPIVIARAIVRDLYEGPRAGREMARMGMIMAVVPAVAPVLGGIMHDLASWRSIFAVMILVGLGLAYVVATRMPESLKARSPHPVSPLGILRSFGDLVGSRIYRAYVGLVSLVYAGLFCFISASSFILQGVYGLSEIVFALVFALNVIGFVAGSMLASRFAVSRGLDGTIAVGVPLLVIGALLMLACVLLGPRSAAEVVVPAMIYMAGVGLVLPQALAAAMAPFPDRAGAASSCLGVVQMTFSALVSAGLGATLGGSALPLPLTMSAVALAAALVFLALRRMKA
ncbi:MAG: multidrug effflux MFS transporter [Hyphomicrobiales bacterium]